MCGLFGLGQFSCKTSYTLSIHSSSFAASGPTWPFPADHVLSRKHRLSISSTLTTYEIYARPSLETRSWEYFESSPDPINPRTRSVEKFFGLFRSKFRLAMLGSWIRWKSILSWGWLFRRSSGDLTSGVPNLCENPCEKNFPKSAKTGKNRKKCGKSYLTISVAYNNLRRLGNSEAVTENPRVGSSILSLGTSKFKELRIYNLQPCFTFLATVPTLSPLIFF